jgi:hypothetical protein
MVTAAIIAECKLTGVELAIEELHTLLAKAPVATADDFRKAAMKVRVALSSIDGVAKALEDQERMKVTAQSAPGWWLEKRED